MEEFKGLSLKTIEPFSAIIASVADCYLDNLFGFGTLDLDLVILALLLNAEFSRDLISAGYFFFVDEHFLLFRSRWIFLFFFLRLWLYRIYLLIHLRSSDSRSDKKTLKCLRATFI